MNRIYRYASRAGGVLATAVLLSACHGQSPPQDTGQASPPAPRTIAAAATAGYAETAATAAAAATLATPKLSPELAAMARKVAMAADATTAHALSTQRVHVNKAGQIQVYVYVGHVDAAMEKALKQAGAQVERSVASMHVYQAWASPDALARIAQLPGVVRITPPAYGFTQ